MWNFFSNLVNLSSNNVKLWNTLSRQKEEFIPIKSGKVGLYTCGPTVYGYPHLGNMRTYVFEDVLKRVLTYNNYKVRHIMNITDVGHLTGDRDMGDDKMEKEAKKEHKTAWEIAEFYTKAFKKDLVSLNIINPDVFCKATDHIDAQIAMIEELEKKGFVYLTSDGVYFDTSLVPDYNKLSHQNLEALKEGARIEKNEEKKNATDFALWKFSPKTPVLHSAGKEKSEKRQMEWKSPWGVGFPGWHIECSAMSMYYLGEQFDIHCGAVDAISIHHTNELAQSEAATGKKPWVRFWLHGEHLNLDGGRKMAKSSGDNITIQNIFIDKKIDPLVFRFATFSTHYRKSMVWNDDILNSGLNSYDNFTRRIKALGKKTGKINAAYKEEFIQAINDDLNISKAIAVANEVFKSDISDKDKLATILDFDRVFGLNLEKLITENKKVEALPDEIGKLMAERQVARNDKNWAESDLLRDKILELGYEIKDTPTGPQVIKK